METRGSQWVSPDTPVEWPCHVCDRLGCRKCTLTIPDSTPSGISGIGEEYYATTYCSESCRAAATPDMLNYDEVMS